MRIHLVRHGIDHLDDRGVRRLSPQGAEQMLRSASTLSSCLPVVLMTSSLRRARESAEVVSAVLGVPASIDNRLDEIRTVLTRGSMPPRERRGTNTRARPDESWPDFVDRASSFLDEMVLSGNAEIVAITHSGIFDAIFEKVTGTSEVELLVDNAAISVWHHRADHPAGSWLLEQHNSSGHLSSTCHLNKEIR
uniref:Histidine phosphatase/phosphoglycerate mutase n=1 Tax=Rathayibacter sp. FH 236 TaxID=2615183 RepID=A0A5J6SFY6_9MICO|nr:histidine phosphatase/phosphoglycerate mutase [Rathayibacter sp. FH 236]